jgi:hypothetical protein
MIKNTVTSKAIVTIDLGDFFPKAEDCVYIDMATLLFKGLILKEADFRQQIKDTDWSTYSNKYVGLFCSADAIVPMWAYMVITAELSGIARMVHFGKKTDFPLFFVHENIAQIDKSNYEGQRVVVKGCGDKETDEQAFIMITRKLALVARAIMFGEACSSVPVFKKTLET